MSLHTVFKIVVNTTYNSTNLLNAVNLFSWMAKDQRSVRFVLVSPRAQVLLPSYHGYTLIHSVQLFSVLFGCIENLLLTLFIPWVSVYSFVSSCLCLGWLRFILVSWVFSCGFNKDFVELFIFFIVSFVITSTQSWQKTWQPNGNGFVADLETGWGETVKYPTMRTTFWICGGVCGVFLPGELNDQMLNACFWEGLDDELYHLLPLDRWCVPVVDFSSDFIVDAVNEDNYYHHPVPTRKHVSTPAHLKHAPSTYLITRTISIVVPVFSLAWEAVSNSADLTAKVADPSIISVFSALNKFPILRSPSPESDLESAPVWESSLESTRASELRRESINPAKKMRLEEKEKGLTLNILYLFHL